MQAELSNTNKQTNNVERKSKSNIFNKNRNTAFDTT